MSDPQYAVVIPARYESTRLPGKPLLKIAGKEMVIRTWERTIRAAPADRVWIATEDERIKTVCEAHGAQVAMTSRNCLTGTDRLVEFARARPGLDFIVNVQGDEPIIQPDDIRAVIDAALDRPDVVWNGMAPVKDEKEWRSRTVPKVVCALDGKLLYMSRSPIPGNKYDTYDRGWKQVCIYSFPIPALEAFGSRSEKTPMESVEDIEILRLMEMGHEVQMIGLSGNNTAVDTLDDLGLVEQYIQQNPDA